MIPLSPTPATDLSPEEKRRLLQELLQKKGAQGRTLPLSAAQHRLWFLAQLDPDLPFYNISRAISLHGALNVEALKQSLTNLLQRHEVLRTAFVASDGQPLQQIAATVPLTFPIQEVATLEAAEAIAEAEAQRPFDLTQAPLWRTILLRISPTHHRLLLIMHHIISDGWTMGILLEELATLYATYQRGETPALPSVGLPYGDYTLRQRQQAQGEQAQADLAYWQRHLAELPTPELPTDYPRPAINSHRGGMVAFHLPAETTTALKQLAQQQGTTFFMAVLAAFQLLMARRTGQWESVVGTPVANRTTADIERTVGFFVNTLVIRTDLRGNPTFRELLQRVRDVTLAAYAHQELPFDRVVEVVQPQRLQSHNPLFQTMFSLHPPTRPLTRMGDLQVEVRTLYNRHAKFDLNGELWEAADGSLQGHFEYSRDIFAHDSIERLVSHFVTLLTDSVARPDHPIADLEILPSGERAFLLERWNGNRPPYPRDTTIHALFEAQVAENPDAVALISGDSTLTYGALNEQAHALAHRLLAAGVAPDSLVAVTVERSPEMVIALLAILKAGAGYLPLDSTLPPQRFSLLLAQSNATVLLTTAALHTQLPLLPHVEVLYIEEGVETSSPSIPFPPVTADHVAYAMFTSGSTGTPKAVAIPHRAVVRLVRDNTFTPLNSQTVLLQLAPLAFDASTLELWGALLNGGRVVMAPPYAPSLAEIGALIRTYGVTTLWLTAGLFHQIVDEDVEALRPIRYLLAGGDVLSPSHVRRVLAQLPDTTVINGYGPTENTTFTTTFPMNRVEAVSHTVPIGTPIAQTQIYLLDEQLHPVPIGVPGELYVGGDGLARGYLHQPALTADKFIPNPFADALGTRLYRTGDIARYRADGTIEFLGRRDFQVKVRGFRIELGEITAALTAHPAIQEAVVTVHQGEHPSDKRLVAYWVPRSAGAITPNDLRAYLGNHLPDYMVPAAFILLSHLPLNINGKVDRAALPAPTWEQNTSAQEVASPTEELLMGLWSQLLNVTVQERQANFFELGGHSLIVTQLFARIRSLFGVELPLRTLFEAPTIAGLARQVDAALRVEPAAPIPPISRQEPLPLSLAQQRLWFLEQYDPNSTTYIIPTVLRWRGALEPIRLERALNQLAERHEVLRTRIVTEDGEAVQQMDAPHFMPLSVEDLSHLPTEEREAIAYQLATAEAQTPFDLATDALVRWKLIRLATDEYFFLLTQHHIITDGWSVGLFLRELATLYDHEGDESPLAPLPIQYADFAHWQRHRLENEGLLESQLDYWRSQLAGAIPLLELPTDFPRPAIQSTGGAHLRSALDGDLTTALRDFSRREGVTLYMTLLAAFQTLLYRLSGQTDMMVGSPVAGRQQQETEGLMGFFVNTVVIRGNLANNPTFRSFLHQIRSTALAAYAHQEVPFERLVESVVSTRSLSHPPLAQVIFALQNMNLLGIAPKGVELSFADSESGSSRVDLTLILTEDTANGTLRVLVEYNTALFSKGTIQRWLGYYETLLHAILQAPTHSVATLPLIPAQEWAQMQAWNYSRRRDYPHTSTISARFEAQVAATPNAVALESGNHQLTYAQLNERANRLAHLLIAHGVADGTRVALCLPRSVESIVALLAILKAGGAYVPLEPHYPVERLAFMVADTAPALILTTETVAKQLPPTPIPVVLLDGLEPLLATQSPTNLPTVRDAERLAYIMYTSGSTGTPKGIGVPQQAVLRLVQNNDFIPQDEHLVFLHLAPLAFDASTLEIWAPLLNGGKLVLYPDELPTPTQLGRTIAEHGVTSLWLTAGLFQQLVESDVTIFRPLRHLLSGGDTLPLAAVQTVLRELPHLRLVNGYGPTENTTFTTCYPMEGESRIVGTVPIGIPIANSHVYLLDAHLQPVPIGVVGELYAGGDGLAWGYWNRPALTAEKFIPHPFSQNAGARLYRTGDLARYRADGTIEFVGRNDFQVKIRGFRIELGEIESVLARHPAVQSAVVVVRQAEDGDKQLVAYIVAETSPPDPLSVTEKGGTERRPTLDTEELRHFVQAQLPDYMRPVAYLLLDEFPLTANGKIDRHALPTPTLSPSAGEPIALPRTPLEELLVMLMESLLEQSPIGVNDDFFARGGHSLRAIQLTAQIRRHIGVELPLRLLFENPTIAGMAHHITALQQGAEASTDNPLRRRADGLAPLPLSFAQERHWFLHQLEPNSTAHNVPFAFRLIGKVNHSALAQAISALVERHEVLRTVFPAYDGIPEQHILPPRLSDGSPLVPLQKIELGQLAPLEQEAAAQQWMEREKQQPFALATGPLFRTTLLTLGAEHHLLLLTLHHIVADGWSTGLLLRDLTTLYDEYQGNSPTVALPELSLQYADFALWQRDRLGQESGMHRQLEYWRERLNEVPLLQLPTDHPRPAVQTFNGGSVPVRLSPTLTTQLHQLSQKEGATLFMVLLAGFYTILHRYTKQSDISVGTFSANRAHPDTQEMLGFFVNNLALRTDLSGNPTVRELIARVRETALGAFAHSEVPFESILEAVQPERSLSHTPLFQVMFVLQNFPAWAQTLGDATLELVRQESIRSDFDLTLWMREEGDHLIGGIEYNCDLFDGETVRRFAAQLELLLGEIATDAQQRIAQVPLLPAPEAAQLLTGWQAHPDRAAVPPFLHQRLSAQAARTPHHTAVIAGRERLTYAELEHRSNQLAHYLQAQGIAPEMVVGIYTGRTVWAAVALWGILKAGGAYLPLDPMYPQSRLAYMVADSGATVVLCDETKPPELPNRVTALDIQSAWGEIRHYPTTPPTTPTLTGDHLAYLIYTSGSTGTPKGVMVTQQSLMSYMEAIIPPLGLTANDKILNFASISFDATTEELYPAWLAGATVLFRPADLVAPTQAFWSLLAEEQLTALSLPVAFWHEWVEDAVRQNRTIPPQLRLLLLNAEEPATERYAQWLKQGGGHVRWVNTYGPTEGTVTATLFEPTPDHAWLRFPIGKPIANTTVYILDKHLQPVPIGVQGELYLGGGGITRGYKNRPDLTALAYIPNPFSNEAGARLYKTGDLARFRADGTIEFFGRGDHQVKVRGFRVELGEIEAVLAHHEAVQEVVVVARELGDPATKRVVAYLGTGEHSTTEDELYQYLQPRLPHYMIPDHFMLLERLPKSPNGKIERRALPVPDLHSRATEATYIAPETPEAEILAEIWADILQLPRVGARDNFFRLGGHSLLATQIVARVRDTFEVELPLRALFERPTVEGLAEVIESLLIERIANMSDEDVELLLREGA